MLPSEVKEAAENSGISLLLAPPKAIQTALPALVKMRCDVITGTILHKAIPA